MFENVNADIISYSHAAMDPGLSSVGSKWQEICTLLGAFILVILMTYILAYTHGLKAKDERTRDSVQQDTKLLEELEDSKTSEQVNMDNSIEAKK